MALGRIQGRIVAGLARAAAPLTLPAAAGAASAVRYCDPKPPRPDVLYSKLGLLESAIVDEPEAWAKRACGSPTATARRMTGRP
jgi:hypothetical protein